VWEHSQFNTSGAIYSCITGRVAKQKERPVGHLRTSFQRLEVIVEEHDFVDLAIPEALS